MASYSHIGLHTAYGQLYRFDNLIDGTSTIYEYDPTGRLVHFTEFDSSAMVNEFSSIIYYDNEGRIDYYDYIGAYTNSSGVNDWSTTYNIDFLNDGRINELILTAAVDVTGETATAVVNFSYDKYNRLDGKTYSYSSASQTFLGFTEYTFTETTAGTSSQIAMYTSTVNGSNVTSTYTYDANGYITKIALSTGAEYRYVYDDLGQLKREDNTVTGKTYVYEYDDAGNITSKKTYALTSEGATPTSPISTITYGYTDSLGWGDLLTSYGGGSITYDAIGNPLTYYNGNSYTFTWENGRQLATVSSDDFELEFVYNDEGIRTQKIVNDSEIHIYHLSGTDIIAEEWGSNLIVYLYDSDGSPMGMQYHRNSMDVGEFYTFWFEKNLQGDIVAVYNSAGIKVISYSYDAWGNCTTTNHNISGTNSYATYNPFRYRGYYFDSELGFYYLNSRYYDPSVGRFINADTLVSTGQGILGYNMFAYCRNEPVFRKDAHGTDDVCVALVDDNGNPLNDLGGTPSGGGGTYHYSVDLSVASRSSLLTGGIYNCGYSTYSWTSANTITGISPNITIKNYVNKPFVPDEYWKREAKVYDVPNSKYTHYMYNGLGQLERSTVIYDCAGRRIIRIDWTNHTRADHGNPHIHFRTYGRGHETGREERMD